MSVREKINQSPAAAGALAVALVVIAIGGIWYSMRPAAYGQPTKAYYTVDEGQTLFVDSTDKVTPFDHGGKEAVKAYVYTCDDGKSQFVAYLEKMPPGAKPVAQAQDAAAEPAVVPKTEAEARALAARRQSAGGPFTVLVKKPGDRDWLKPGSPGYFAVISPKCPSPSQKIDRVFP